MKVRSLRCGAKHLGLTLQKSQFIDQFEATPSWSSCASRGKFLDCLDSRGSPTARDERTMALMGLQLAVGAGEGPPACRDGGKMPSN